MKKIGVLLFLTFFVIGISSCDNAAEEAETAEAAKAPVEETAPVEEEPQDGILVENAFWFTHVDGHKKETEKIGYVLFEYEQLENVKYQVGYIACTCRGPQVNYWSVAYVELSKEDGSVSFISWDEDSTGHYTAGMYGDSYVTWEGVEAHDLLHTYVEDNIVGKPQEYVNDLKAMHGDVDEYTGATVTPNNAVRMLQGLFTYHNERYM
ncbi:MAG: hypothetical protein K9L75_06145 [Spirochaetia bacterium]|nr:hypothetical protein [Spirochaetia bacterium]